jgi:hypothetical protein
LKVSLDISIKEQVSIGAMSRLIEGPILPDLAFTDLPHSTIIKPEPILAIEYIRIVMSPIGST